MTKFVYLVVLIDQAKCYDTYKVRVEFSSQNG